jgi:hypothetical protein
MGTSNINPITLHTGINRRRFLRASAVAAVAAATSGLVSAANNYSNRAEIDELRQNKPNEDLNAKETRQAQIYWTRVRSRAKNMYRAEEEDNAQINYGLIKPEERKVKISLVDFSPPSIYSASRQHKQLSLYDDELQYLYPQDGGSQATLFVAKYFDDVQRDGTILRTYVNEQWPIIITEKSTIKHTLEDDGITSKEVKSLELGILPTEVFRFSVQLFPGDLHKPGAEDLMVRDMVQAIWALSSGGLLGESGNGLQDVFATLFRQHLWGEHNPEKYAPFSNQYQQLHTPVSTTSYVQCHNPASSTRFAKKLFLEGKERTNYAATVPDEEFSDVKPITEQRGYKMLISFMERRLKEGEVLEEHLNTLKRQLSDTRSFENPHIIQSLENTKSVPFVEEDKPPVYRGETMDNGFLYYAQDEEGKYDLNKPIYRNQAIHFKNDLIIGGWWIRNTPVIPHGRF